MHILTHIQRVKDGTIIDKNILSPPRMASCGSGLPAEWLSCSQIAIEASDSPFVKAQQPAERKDGNQRRSAPVTERHEDQAPDHITLG